MLITRDFVFVHVPKTGGDFIRKVCARHLPADRIVTTGIAKNGADTEIPAEYRHLPRFALVRNPWDWHVSWYHYLVGAGRPEAHRERVRQANPIFAALSDDFTAGFTTTIGRLYDPEPRLDLLSLHLRSQVGASLAEGRITVGRFETLREDFLAFLQTAGVPLSDEFRADLLHRPPVNRSSRGPFKAYYDERTLDLVARLAADPIARYGYTFEDPTAPPARSASGAGATPPSPSSDPSPGAASAEGHIPLMILGGHRSGTSLVAGLLWHAGLHLGNLLGAAPDNPRGFFESVDVLAAHEAILYAQDRDWTCPPHRLDPGASDLTLLRRAAASLAAAGRPWGVKDPRLLFLLPAWLEVAPALRFIGVVRHPAAVARSLERRNGFTPQTARAIADLHLARLAALHRALRFPLIGFDGPVEQVVARTRAVAASLGLSWDESAAASLYDPGLRHQAPHGPGGPEYDYLQDAMAALPETPQAHDAPDVAAALAAAPEAAEGLPLTLGPAFAARRTALWEAFAAALPPVGRVLDLAPAGAIRDPALPGVDPTEIDAADAIGPAAWSGGDDAYTHAILTGVAETLPLPQLEELLTRLAGATSSDAAVVLDALVVDGIRAPRTRHWRRLGETSCRTGPLHHQHLDEIELAALEADWLVGDVALDPEGRSRVLLVKQAHRRAPGWLTQSERRGRQQVAEQALAQLEREKERHRLAYETLLEENASLPRSYYKQRDEVQRLRRLRTVRGWLAHQGRRLRPSRLARAIRRRRGPGTG